ncbi:glucose-1-phosphate thymidylyltransferase RfbA [Amycolatopsis circi]|uniref:glucose-1-phosphate thymidylyltransferase RfbA n=1 Tax=Amycolatopsis circi TaxID=871959 RepID=UPI000E225600|nr:glucose-1-phosphate thymidylyltransferase RfbA [Amycolatopsis circi]
MKGIVFAGGSETRLHPITQAVSKQLLPLYDKPMIYHPISVLMLAGIRDILVVSPPGDLPWFERLLGDGDQFGISLSYAQQSRPNGIAEAFVIGAEHIGGDSVALILGDNLFHGPGFSPLLRRKAAQLDGCVLFGRPVDDPGRYGVAELDHTGRLVSIEEKPAVPRSDLAVTGLYFYANDVVDLAKNLAPSQRGELEITDINTTYVERGTAEFVQLGRGFAWLDTATPDSFLEAAQYVQVLEHRTGVRIGCLEEVALRMGFIDAEACRELGERMRSPYGGYVTAIAGTAPTRIQAATSDPPQTRP